jgi:hypothetical protein
MSFGSIFWLYQQKETVTDSAVTQTRTLIINEVWYKTAKTSLRYTKAVMFRTLLSSPGNYFVHCNTPLPTGSNTRTKGSPSINGSSNKTCCLVQ